MIILKKGVGMSRTAKIGILALILCMVLGAGTAFAQIRLDAGVDVFMGAGIFSESNDPTFQSFGQLLGYFPVMPFPEAGLYYQFDLGIIKLGAGVRCFTFIIESVFWPNLIAEAHLGNVVIEAQVGGGYFGFFGLGTGGTPGQVFFPDLSVSYAFGDVFRLGVGAIGIFIPQLSTDILPFLFYVGGKFSFVFK
jgi:hypothetical protein